MHGKKYPVIDLFAGPGGLGEGFSAFEPDVGSSDKSGFSLVVSVEKETNAYQSLKIRSYFRALQQAGLSLDNYYDWLNFGNTEELPYGYGEQLDLWFDIEEHGDAVQHELGFDDEADTKLEDHVLQKLEPFSEKPVLIGGPPCQAYSIAGRARNMANGSYKAETDYRHYLYLEYLRFVHRTQPAVFVMENVRGILSSKVHDRLMFPQILQDLAVPSKAINESGGKRYVIHSLVSDCSFQDGDNPDLVDGREFLIRSEMYGIPQARHRVILLGIEEGLNVNPGKLENKKAPSVKPVLSGLPKLRSSLSREKDSQQRWLEVMSGVSVDLIGTLAQLDGQFEDVIQQLEISDSNRLLWGDKLDTSAGTRRSVARSLPASLRTWYGDRRLKRVLNHESRGQMVDDLRRYLFVAAYGRARNVSPKARHFPPFLAPNHRSWSTGHFADRFRVQIAGGPATTVTSHISKDGHYFIHPDPVQCRSLSVREAARLQTFPDNYIFMGARTPQFVQVGNAVPPLLARQIARIVHDILERNNSPSRD